jgi:DNA repair exonuclease SbcCD nuclease subunit
MLHTSASGSVDHDRYAPCTVDALRAKGYGYWALGHIHKRETLCSTDAWVAFPGNVQGRHIREPGAKGCLLVTVDDRGEVASVDFRPLDVLRWETCRVDAEGLASVDDLYPRFEAAASSLLAGSDGRPVVARVEVVGTCPAHDAIEAKGPRVVADLRATALRVGGNFWVEKVKLATRAEPSALGPDEPGDDALGVLREVIDGLKADPESLRALARAEFEDLRTRLAAERDGFDRLDLDSTEWLLDALERARPILQDRLRGAAGTG